MIHVCSLARLYSTVDETGARHIVTLLRLTDRVERPPHIAPENHLVLALDDITTPMDGYIAPGEEHVERLIDFVGGWDRAAPMVVHCFAGISRSTAGAYRRRLRAQPGTRRTADRLGHPPRLAHGDAQRAHRHASPTGCSSATAAWCARSRPSVRVEFAEEGVPFRLDIV